jgi:hypothetical protein
MKKKLEAELISIAHRILKLKNRAELDQLQAETLKLYEKLSVLKFVEDNFSEVKPTIGFASAEEKLEEVYGLDEVADKESDSEENVTEKPKTATKKTAKAKDEKEEESEAVTAKEEEAPVAEAEKEETKEAEVAPEVKEEVAEEPEAPEAEAEEEVKEETPAEEVKAEEPKDEPAAEKQEEAKEEPKEEKEEEPVALPELEKTEAELRSIEESAKMVYKFEQDTNLQEEAAATDAEVKTIEPQADAKVEDSGVKFEFAFDRPAAPEEPIKQKEITFEDFHDYKEPEFVKKGADEVKPAEPDQPKQEEAPKAEATDWRNWEPSKPAEAEKPKEEPKAEEPAPVKDWRDWEPAKAAEPEKPAPVAEQRKAEPTPEPVAKDWRDWEPAKEPEQPKAEEPKAKTLNDALGKTISLGLNDRIAFEKNLFGGSGEDLNRVLSQLNTLNTFAEAKDFIKDLVKPDYSNWQGKEEYEERFMEIVEKKFN